MSAEDGSPDYFALDPNGYGQGLGNVDYQPVGVQVDPDVDTVQQDQQQSVENNTSQPDAVTDQPGKPYDLSQWGENPSDEVANLLYGTTTYIQQSAVKPYDTSQWGVVKEEPAQNFIEKILHDTWGSADGNVKTNIAAALIGGMFSAKNRQAESDAKVKTAEASMINANSNAAVNANTIAIKNKQMENASGIINATNYGKSTAKPVYQDLLAQRRARNGA